jgi:hypothetical protein
MEKTNRGAFRKNKQKEKDTHPDIKGQINVEGKDYWLSAWQRTGEDGIWYSVALTEKEAKPTTNVEGDDIPF